MKRIHFLLMPVAVCLGLVVSIHAEALPTKVRVRAVSRDAKIIGSKVGGVLITIQEAQTGEILARGVQLGGTGDTNLIMVKPRERHATVFDTEESAFFETVLMLDRPTQVEITAEGPLGFEQARQRSSKSLLLIPGQDVVGEGVLLEIHGFIIQLLTPAEFYAGRPAEVKARLNMT